MNIQDAGLHIIKFSETSDGKPILVAYLCPSKVWTIGWGHTKNVFKGMTIGQEQAEAFLRQDLAWVEDAVNHYAGIPLTQNMFDALCSFVFNIGSEAFRKSTLLALLNEADIQGAANQFQRWNKGSFGKVLPGLVKRRAQERDLFLL